MKGGVVFNQGQIYEEDASVKIPAGIHGLIPVKHTTNDLSQIG